MNKKQQGHTFHRDKCQARMRKSYTTKFGSVIVLFGKHAFEWSVGVTKNDGKAFMSITTYPNREKATQEYNKLCKTMQ